MNSEQPDTQNATCEPFLPELWHVIQGLVVVGMLGSFGAHVVGTGYALITGTRSTQGIAASAPAIIVRTPSVAPGDPVIDAVLSCIVTGIVVYTLLVAVCSAEWVKKKHKIKKCFEHKKWYNPW